MCILWGQAGCTEEKVSWVVQRHYTCQKFPPLYCWTLAHCEDGLYFVHSVPSPPFQQL